jgi:uncharacterized protein YciI
LDYLVYCRDHPGTGALREQLSDAHQEYMDRYVARMTARGPTLSEDGDTATGSMHIVDLPDADAARAFAFEEPNYQAGVYAEVAIWCWENMLGRTMWDFAGGAPDRRFLVIGHAKHGLAAPDESHHGLLADAEHRDHLIVYGPLLSDDGSAWRGIALAVELPSRQAVEDMLARDPIARTGLYERIEIHRWQFGGRR